MLTVKNFISNRYDDITQIQGFHVHNLRIDPSKGYSFLKISLGDDENGFKKFFNEDICAEIVM